MLSSSSLPYSSTYTSVPPVSGAPMFPLNIVLGGSGLRVGGGGSVTPNCSGAAYSNRGRLLGRIVVMSKPSPAASVHSKKTSPVPLFTRALETCLKQPCIPDCSAQRFSSRHEARIDAASSFAAGCSPTTDKTLADCRTADSNPERATGVDKLLKILIFVS